MALVANPLFEYVIIYMCRVWPKSFCLPSSVRGFLVGSSHKVTRRVDRCSCFLAASVFFIGGLESWRLNMTSEELRLLHQDLLNKIQLKEKVFDPKDDHHYECLDKQLNYLRLDPFQYIGIICINFPDYAISPITLTLPYAIYLGYRRYLELLETNQWSRDYVTIHFKKSLEDIIIENIKLGEREIEMIQEARNMNRTEALTFCIDFNLVSDNYILACPEFYRKGIAELLKLRPKLVAMLDNKCGGIERFKRSKKGQFWKSISRKYYESNC